MNIGSQIVSKLGSPNSKIPLAIKDICNSASCTYFSYNAGGEVEGKDRLVDEIGTGALWLFGIPAYKKLIDKTIFKGAKVDPNIDVRILKDESYLRKAIENAPTDEIKNSLKNATKNISKVKKLNIVKFGLSLGLTMLSYFGLTKYKQAMTKRNIEKEFMQKQMKARTNVGYYEHFERSDVFNDFDNKGKSSSTPSFGSAAVIKAAENIMLNPIKNMMVLDGCISGERLAHSRTKGEFKENLIKEGSFLFFVYGADKAIKKGINWISEKVLKTPIDLDINLITSDLAKNILDNEATQSQIHSFAKEFGQNADKNKLFEYILKNQNHPIVEAAKKSGIISTIKDKSGNLVIDTRKYIDADEMNKLANSLEKFINSQKTSGKTTKQFLNKIKGLKVGSTFANIGICCLALGYIVPKMMYKSREKEQNGNKDFHVKTEYEKELAKKVCPHFKSVNRYAILIV